MGCASRFAQLVASQVEKDVHEAKQSTGVDLTLVEGGKHVEQLDQVEEVEESRGLELHTDQALDPLRLLANIDPGDHRPAAVGLTQALEDLDGRGLSGAVGAKDPEDLTLLHPEGDAVDGNQRAVGLAQAFDLDGEPVRLRDGLARSRGRADAQPSTLLCASGESFARNVITTGPGRKPSSGLRLSIPAFTVLLSV